MLSVGAGHTFYSIIHKDFACCVRGSPFSVISVLMLMVGAPCSYDVYYFLHSLSEPSRRQGLLASKPPSLEASFSLFLIQIIGFGRVY